jgi:hypothetical protein
MYKGHIGACGVILEAVADYVLWIWHAFFGMSGSHNGINMLQRPPVFAEGNAPLINYMINDHTYTKGYCLSNGIYPEWSTTVKTIRDHLENK